MLLNQREIKTRDLFFVHVNTLTLNEMCNLPLVHVNTQTLNYSVQYIYIER